MQTPWRRAIHLVLVLACACSGNGNAHAASVERESPDLDRLLSADAELTTLYKQYDGFFEGPSWVEEDGGFLVVSAIPDNRLLKIDRRGRVSVLVPRVVQRPAKDLIHDTLYTNRDLSGSNGTAAVGRNKLLVAMFGGQAIAEVDLKTRRIIVLASGASSPTFELPNDIVVGPSCDIYFSAHEGIYRLHRGRIIEFRKMSANGLAFRPDGQALFATDGPTRIVKIELNADGSAGQTSTFIDTKGDPAKGEFVDGMKVDASGNIWATGPGGIWILNPQGKRLGRIRAPTVEMPTGKHNRFTNLAFGGKDGSSLFLTAPGGVYSLPLARGATTPLRTQSLCGQFGRPADKRR